jgi:hypothetical protein
MLLQVIKHDSQEIIIHGVGYKAVRVILLVFTLFCGMRFSDASISAIKSFGGIARIIFTPVVIIFTLIVFYLICRTGNKVLGIILLGITILFGTLASAASIYSTKGFGDTTQITFTILFITFTVISIYLISYRSTIRCTFKFNKNGNNLIFNREYLLGKTARTYSLKSDCKFKICKSNLYGRYNKTYDINIFTSKNEKIIITSFPSEHEARMTLGLIKNLLHL